MKRYIQLLFDHGFFRFTHKALGVVDRTLCGSWFSRHTYLAALRTGTPYFGNYLAANQGNFRRHHYMDRLVKALAAKAGPNKGIDILEVGSYAGASTVIWLKALTKYCRGQGTVFCVDPWDSLFSLDDGTGGILNEMTTALRDGSIFNLFSHNVRNSGLSEAVRIRKAFFHDIAAELESDGLRFDIVYIDGDHRRDAVHRDLTLGARLLKPGGVLCGDDLELQMGEVDPDTCAHNREKDFIEDPRTHRFYHPGVCAAVHDFFGRRRVSAWVGFWAMRRTELAGFDTVIL